MQNKVYFKTHEINSVQEAMNIFSSDGKCRHIADTSNTLSDSYVFRGQKNKRYKLVPSVLREDEWENIYKLANDACSVTNHDWEITQISVEYNIIKRFYNLADKTGLDIPQVPLLRNSIDSEIDTFMGSLSLPTQPKEWLPDELYEIAGLAQHYGLPTRLLDWTYDYKVALYFAVSGIYNNKDRRADCVLWALNQGSFNLVNSEKYLCPLRFFRPSYHNNKFLSAQKGLFSTWKIPETGDLSSLKESNGRKAEPINRCPLDELIIDFVDRYIKDGKINPDDFEKNKILYQFIIPAKLKNDILTELGRNGYSEEYLFPGFQNVVSKLKSQGRLPEIQDELEIML
ncbi:hypothetical protein AGMMS50267_11470 [Spirochaetia bacterium]|nr:hypothetical protein AGMMS50267_11470 [Spirochaetia bacterium]